MLLNTFTFVVIPSIAAVFFIFFGHPTYVKYPRKDTVFTETKVRYDSMHPPAITIYAWKGSLFNGWKNTSIAIYLIHLTYL
jgi:hypothetical protein